MIFRGREKMTDPKCSSTSSLISFVEQTRPKERNSRQMANQAKIVVVVFLIAATFMTGVLIGCFVIPKIKSIHFGKDFKTKLLDEISKDEIERHLKFLTRQPHLSGTEGDERVVKYIQDHWKSLNLDSVETVSYKVLLSSPDRKNPNLVTVHNKKGKVIAQSSAFEPILVPEQNDSRIVPPFNAYSPPGIVKGNLVYLNYGRVSDFELAVKKGIPIEGSICLLRYGFGFRADKVKLGEQHGCIGMIMYSDPADFDVDAHTKVYPDSWSLPPGGVQRGTIKESSGNLGDPLTPLYPSTDYAFRIKASEAGLPGIPCHPIGYGDAEKLFKYIGGDEVPASWQGGMKVTYRFGSHLRQDASYVQLSVSTNSSIGTIHNIFGVISGAVEPDRYVMIGNHHDAWVFGAVDPSSATAVMLELSAAFSRLMNEGWRPRRTIMFCAWGGEEQGVIGSREWTEEYGKVVASRAVAYLNVDNAIQGRFVFKGRALPLLNSVMFEAAKSVPNPDREELKAGRKFVYDTWVRRTPDATAKFHKPKVALIGSGSDFSPFVSSLGISSADLRFTFDPRMNLSSYPLYHTGYETYHLFATYHDPGFLYSRALAQVWGEMGRLLADSAVLPLNVSELHEAMEGFFVTFEERHHKVLVAHNIDLSHLASAVKNFTRSSEDFEFRLSNIDKQNLLLLRQYNDQLMHLERSFIDFAGLPGRPSVRNVLYAPSRFNSYSATVFPGVSDALFELTSQGREPQRHKLVEEVERQISILTFFVQSAADLLKDPSDFVRSE